MCKRNIDQLPLTCPQLGTWPTTQACPLTRNQQVTFQSISQLSIHWATPARARDIFLKRNLQYVTQTQSWLRTQLESSSTVPCSSYIHSALCPSKWNRLSWESERSRWYPPCHSHPPSPNAPEGMVAMWDLPRTVHPTFSKSWKY